MDPESKPNTSHVPFRSDDAGAHAMTKKDFEVIARAIATMEIGKSFYAAHVKMAAHMANHLEETNPRFNRSVFILACMPRWMVGTAHANRWEREARK
jgi:hypothetical protein